MSTFHRSSMLKNSMVTYLQVILSFYNSIAIVLHLRRSTWMLFWKISSVALSICNMFCRWKVLRPMYCIVGCPPYNWHFHSCQKLLDQNLQQNMGIEYRLLTEEMKCTLGSNPFIPKCFLPLQDVIYCWHAVRYLLKDGAMVNDRRGRSHDHRNFDWWRLISALKFMKALDILTKRWTSGIWHGRSALTGTVVYSNWI